MAELTLIEAVCTALSRALEDDPKVIIFGEDTPLRLIKRIRPDVLVKGGEWSQDAIVGADVVEAAGGKVVRIKMIKGISTTRLARSIRGG